jgi:hypothetical protein
MEAQRTNMLESSPPLSTYSTYCTAYSKCFNPPPKWRKTLRSPGYHYGGFTITLSPTKPSYDSSRKIIRPTQRPLPDNAQHSKETDIHAQGGIRTHNTSKRTAADPSLAPGGH